MSSNQNSSDCGCGAPAPTKNYGNNVGCGKTIVQQPPQPCCESHDVKYIAGNCLLVSCDVVAANPSFPISFSNTYIDIPIDANHVFFKHASAGFLRVVGVTPEGSYEVALEDTSLAGAYIRKNDCVLIHTERNALNSINPFQRCLVGTFNVPTAPSGRSNIFIRNGTSIPLGSTITFTYEGVTGSYLVTNYVSSEGSLFAYEVQNTGSGHTNGPLMTFGDDGFCSFPVEVITDVDLCDLASTGAVDSLTGCKNGSPFGFKSEGINDIVKGDGVGGWTRGQLISDDCCVITNGVLKFNPPTCPDGDDSVVLRADNIACFEALWNEVAANPTSDGRVGQTKLPLVINGLNYIATAYVSGTKTLTLKPSDNILSAVEYPAGTQICVAQQCKTCLNGNSITPYFVQGVFDPQYNSIYSLDTTALIAWNSAGKKRYLVGLPYGAAISSVGTALELTPGYNIVVAGGKPQITDPLLLRNKLCNNSVTNKKGCDQLAKLFLNFELAFDPVPNGVRVHYEVAHVAESAKFLADDATLNPFTAPGTQNQIAGYIEGPSSSDAAATLSNTRIGLGTPGQPKIFPYVANGLVDFIYVERCNCIESIVWLYVETEVLPGGPAGSGTINSTIRTRHVWEMMDANERVRSRNNPSSAGFK